MVIQHTVERAVDTIIDIVHVKRGTGGHGRRGVAVTTANCTHPLASDLNGKGEGRGTKVAPCKEDKPSIKQTS